MISLKDEELMKNPEVLEWLEQVNEKLRETVMPILESSLYKEGLEELSIYGKTYKFHEAFKNHTWDIKYDNRE